MDAASYTYIRLENKGKKAWVAIPATKVKIGQKVKCQPGVVMNNFTPGTMEKLGLGYEDLKKINPKIVWASVTGYGQTGPYRERPSYDIIVQAMGGAMSYTGEPGKPPVRCGIPIGDLGGAVFAVIGILSALVSRSVTGEGRMVDISMLDVQIALHTYRAKYYFVAGKSPSRWEQPTSAMFRFGPTPRRIPPWSSKLI